MQLLSVAPSRHVLLVVDTPEWTSTNALPGVVGAAEVEVVSCSSIEEAWSALASGRQYSAVIARQVDPRLADAAMKVGTPVLGGCAESLPGDLADVIGAAPPVRRADRPPDLGPAAWTPSGRARPDGRLVAVCGPGGTGTSSVTAALAFAFASASLRGHLRHPTAPEARSGATADRLEPAYAAGPEGRIEPRSRARSSPTLDPAAPACPTVPPTVGRPAGGLGERVLLADFALRADQAFLHGLSDPGPGLLQLVEAARYRRINSRDAHRHTVAQAGCRLLPGLARPAHWTAVGITAFNTVLSGLLGLFDLVLADITGDLEGEIGTGSMDVEERNHMARRSAAVADVVVVVGAPGTNGARRLAGLVNDLLDLGVDPARIQPVFNRIGPVAPRPWVGVCGLPAAPIGLQLVADARGRLLPPEVVQPVASAVDGLFSRLGAPDRTPALVAVAPGSLGCLTP